MAESSARAPKRREGRFQAELEGGDFGECGEKVFLDRGGETEVVGSYARGYECSLIFLLGMCSFLVIDFTFILLLLFQ